MGHRHFTWWSLQTRIDVDYKQMGYGKILNNSLYRKDIAFREFWNKTSSASDYLYLNNKLPEAKCIRKCVNFICWNVFSILNIWLLAKQCKASFPPKPRWMDCNNRSDSDLQFDLPKARSNSGAKMIKHSAIEIWSRIP